MRRSVTAVLGLAALATGTLTAPAAQAAPPAPAPAPRAGGYNGICTGADALTGVTVVVDFQELDGNGGTAAPTLTRCSPNPTPGAQRTGIQALQDAGIAVAGVAQWGLAFVCRLNGRPSATEAIPVAANPNYKEACIVTPPGAAYWSYWHADGSGTTWTYSNYGALNRNVVPGGFEGWSFSLNKTASTNPVPGVTPRNPAVQAGKPTVSLSVNDLDRKIKLGQSTSLTWTSRSATALSASKVAPATGGGAWSGALAVPGGSKTVKPTAKGTYTYTITATGTGGTVTSTATLTVQ
ncbi:hypothetical protein [Actinomadura hibisca]|uniref:hypothetical protein n=1 Tax=Actinomadura hibisca TaxID=68565 RepID=UPI000B23AB7C|nr:hypothetical protein [Actinomadura hibisca]